MEEQFKNKNKIDKCIVLPQTYMIYTEYTKHGLIPFRLLEKVGLLIRTSETLQNKIGHDMCLLGIYIFNCSNWNYAVHKKFNYTHKIMVVITTF